MGKEKIEIQDLAYNNRDTVVSVLKSLVGIIPFAGPAAQELLGAIIPKQRLDRVIIFIQKLSEDFQKLYVQVEELERRMYAPEYSSFFYKACTYSADSNKEERIENIKNIFIKGLLDSESEVIRHEALLSLLNKLNDIELIYLRIYHLLKWDIIKAREYMEKTGYSVLTPLIYGHMSQEQMDKENSKMIYLNNLTNLGLLDIEYDAKGKEKYKCSNVGDILMRTIEAK